MQKNWRRGRDSNTPCTAAYTGGDSPADSTSANDRNVFMQYLFGYVWDLTKGMI